MFSWRMGYVAFYVALVANVANVANVALVAYYVASRIRSFCLWTWNPRSFWVMVKAGTLASPPKITFHMICPQVA